ncbi:MAG: hypothetical protein DRP85_01950 [Candidatus Makaraimicrobium thalassicum]|nr:MAG: hypothetical protein DRP85_01950 [Candidatus Omnitrophota bacterium]
MKRGDIRVLVILLAVSFALSGCAQIKDKFVRKPKEEKGIAKRYRPVREYDVRPSLELYTKRYIFWKNWHKELLSVLGDANHKKKVVAAEQGLSNLLDMQNMLVDEKAGELQKLIDEMAGIETALKTEKVTRGTEVRMRKKLESLGRQIKREFSYNKMRGYIRGDFKNK